MPASETSEHEHRRAALPANARRCRSPVGGSTGRRKSVKRVRSPPSQPGSQTRPPTTRQHAEHDERQLSWRQRGRRLTSVWRSPKNTRNTSRKAVERGEKRADDAAEPQTTRSPSTERGS